MKNPLFDMPIVQSLEGNVSISVQQLMSLLQEIDELNNDIDMLHKEIEVITEGLFTMEIREWTTMEDQIEVKFSQVLKNMIFNAAHEEFGGQFDIHTMPECWISNNWHPWEAEDKPVVVDVVTLAAQEESGNK